MTTYSVFLINKATDEKELIVDHATGETAQRLVISLNKVMDADIFRVEWSNNPEPDATSYSVIVRNRSTGLSDILINGLTFSEAQAHAERVKRIFPNGFVAGHVSQGFDITVEPEPEEQVTGKTARMVAQGLLNDLRHYWTLGDSHALRAQNAMDSDVVYAEHRRRADQYRTMAQNIKAKLLELIPAERTADDIALMNLRSRRS
jgi:hypothetical protein